MSKFFTALLVIISFLISCTSPSSRKTIQSHEQMMINATRNEKNGWIVVHLEGTPEVIGYQHGYFLAGEIIDLRGAMAMLNEKTTGKTWKFYRDESIRLFWQGIPEEYQKELDGIVAGVNKKLGEGKIDRLDALAMNSILETS